MKCFDNKNKKKKSKWKIIGFELKANDKDLYAVVRVSKASLLMFLIDGYRMLLKKKGKVLFLSRTHHRVKSSFFNWRKLSFLKKTREPLPSLFLKITDKNLVYTY